MKSRKWQDSPQLTNSQTNKQHTNTYLNAPVNEVELAEVCISLRVSIDKGLERAAIGASLGHVHLVVAQQNLRVNHLPA